MSCHNWCILQCDYALLSENILVLVDTRIGHQDRGRKNEGCHYLEWVLQGWPRFWVSVVLVPQANDLCCISECAIGSCDCGRSHRVEDYFYECSCRALCGFRDNREEHQHHWQPRWDLGKWFTSKNCLREK